MEQGKHKFYASFRREDPVALAYMQWRLGAGETWPIKVEDGLGWQILSNVEIARLLVLIRTIELPPSATPNGPSPRNVSLLLRLSLA